MRRLVENAKKQLNGFVEQRNHLLMLVGCSDDDSAIGLKVLRDIEQSNGTDVFLVFMDDFTQAAPYVSVAMERLREEHRMANEALKEEGRDPLPPMPQELFDEKQPPSHRLRTAAWFSRMLLPREGGHRLIWAMFPQRIHDREQYLRLVFDLAPRDGVKSWMAGLRFVFRDLPDTLAFAPGAAALPRTTFGNLDFSPKAIEESLDQDARDQELPEDQRMQSLLMSAAMDAAHQRTQDALGKYELVLGYFQKTANTAMQAFVLMAYGDIYRRVSDLASAQHWYESALTPAVEAKDPLILAALGRNLGEIAFQTGRFADAEQYFDGVDQLAAHSLDVENKIRALETKGLCQERLGAYDRAATSWSTAAGLSRKVGLPEFLSQNLLHLERAYRSLGDEGQANVARQEREALQGERAVM